MTKNKLYQECLLKPASFVGDGRLHGISTVRHLLRQQAPLHPEDQCQAALDCFLRNNEIDALPVVDSTCKPIGLLYRKHYIEFFSGLYAREIFGRRTLRDLLEYDGYERIDPVIVEDTCSIEDVARIIINAGMQYMVTGFIVASEGTYLGIANGHDLLNILTQRKQAELYYLAHYDALTGIPNRALLLDRLDIALHDAKRNGHLVALLFVDVDRFKQINDSLGHAAGDAALRQIVARLKAIARSSDTVARLGGDEFVILAEHVDNENDVDAIAHRLIKSMQEPLELLGHALVATISVGCAIYPIDDQLSSPLLAKADAAMYKAKSEGRNNFRRYSPDSSVYNPAIIMLENDLRQAIEQEQLTLHYQPQVDLITHTIKGFEALVRWHHPVRGLVSPAQFIPLAEECGLIVPMGEWVLRHALKQLRTWQDDGLGPCRMSINISARQIQESGFTAFLEQQLLEHQVNPNLVELELTESILMKDVETVLDTLLRIKALGVSLAVDDFGTGFSSLSYLQRFPIDRLKIDQSFVRNIESTPANESIARAIVALAHSLSLETIAEGIENPAEQKILERLQCSEGQGYLFARPLPANEVVSWAGLKSPPESRFFEQPCGLHSRSSN